ncbi:MAG: HesA/MoeB/ThiF family protein [Bacteroidia bacterium]
MIKFSKEELVRYSRQLILPEVGKNGQTKLKAAKVLVIGAGGIGCPVLQYLCAAGIGTIGIVDFDTVELHNLHRQILYTPKDIGKLKTEAAIERLKAQNQGVDFKSFNCVLNDDNASELINQFDIVVDGCDNFATRYTVNDTCVANNKILVSGSILKFEGQVVVFNYKGSKNLRDLYPEAPNPEDVPSCSEVGVLGAVTGTIGCMMSAMTIDILLDQFKNANMLHLFNFKDYSIQKLSF